jgi:hypothetical protein
MTAELFLEASRKAWRFDSPQGQLTAEQLWSLQLTSTVSSKATLNNVAVGINNQIQSLTQNSFVDSSNDSVTAEFTKKLDLVKYIISVKKTEAKAAADRVALRQQLTKLRAIDAEAQDEALKKMTPEQRAAQLAALEAQLAELTFASAS